MSIIFWQQLHDHLKSTRFQLSLLLLLLFFVANGVVYTWKLERLQTEMAVTAAGYEQVYETTDSVDRGVRQRFRILGARLLGTEFIVDGGVDMLATAMNVSTRTGSLPYMSQALTFNLIIDNFEVIDWAFIVRLVLSFLCIVLAYDTVSRELESGTLRTVLANSLSRLAFLGGKGLAHLVTVLFASLLGAIVSLAILSFTGTIHVNLQLAGTCAVFLVGVVLYCSLYLGVAMGVSALVRTSATASVVLVMIWAVLTVVLPQASALIGRQSHDVPFRPWEAAYDYFQGTAVALHDRGITLRPGEDGRIDGYQQELQYAAALREAEKEEERLIREMMDRQAGQYRVARAVNLLSPGYALQYSLESMLGVGVSARDALEERMWRYRRNLRESFQQIDTQDPDSPHVLFFPGYLSRAPMDPARIPRFEDHVWGLTGGHARSMVPMLVLLLEAVASGLFAVWALNRADLTRD
jgi:ABC-type transport system involved in multi-copper enzyme maturation permease subunit